MTTSDHVLDGPARAALQRRTLRTLAVGQVVGAAALASAVTVGAFVIQGILGSDTPWSGLATATVTTGTAVMSQRLSQRMARHGRRHGLQLGYGLAVVGGGIAAVGAELGNLVVFLVGLFLYGNGQAANLLARYAATDLAEPDERGRAMSRIVFASTFGAVAGPLLIGSAQRAGQDWFGVEKYTGPWIFSAGFFALAGLNTALRLRPDPLLVARRGAPASELDRPRRSIVSSIRIAALTPAGRLALASMMVSQATMVAVMAMTPVHLKLHGHESVSQYVVSLHIAGMFAFSPWSVATPTGEAVTARSSSAARCSSPPRRWHRCPVMSSSCCSPRCGCSGSGGTSVSSAARACWSTQCHPRSEWGCRAWPTC
jgi:hypothetical protein